MSRSEEEGESEDADSGDGGSIVDGERDLDALCGTWDGIDIRVEAIVADRGGEEGLVKSLTSGL